VILVIFILSEGLVKGDWGFHMFMIPVWHSDCSREELVEWKTVRVQEDIATCWHPKVHTLSKR